MTREQCLQSARDWSSQYRWAGNRSAGRPDHWQKVYHGRQCCDELRFDGRELPGDGLTSPVVSRAGIRDPCIPLQPVQELGAGHGGRDQGMGKGEVQRRLPNVLQDRRQWLRDTPCVSLPAHKKHAL